MLALQYILHIIHMYTHWQLALHSSHMSVKRKAGCMVLCRFQMLTLLAAVAMFGHNSGAWSCSHACSQRHQILVKL